MNFLKELPNKLRLELSKIMHDNIIQKLYFFRVNNNFSYLSFI